MRFRLGILFRHIYAQACQAPKANVTTQGVGQLQQRHHVLQVWPHRPSANAIRCGDRSPDGGRSPTRTGPTPSGTTSSSGGSRRGSRMFFFCTGYAVSASTVSFRRTAAISLQLRCPGGTACGAQAPASSPSRSPGGGHGSALPQDGGLPRSIHVCGLSSLPLPAPTADGRRRPVGQLSAVARAGGPLAFAVLATRYGDSGMSMWCQRDRSLVPCLLMALIR